jgi:hypothetical protein
MAAIDKFACTEALTLIKVHSAALYQWATNEQGCTVDPLLKEAALCNITRLYELVEELPVPARKVS